MHGASLQQRRPPSALAVIGHEAAKEWRAGWRSSLPALVLLGLIGYLWMVLGNADYLHRIGGVGMARNAPAVVYMMSSGQLFLLLFAWAWLFAQIIQRDRSASLHEVMLAAPVSLPALLLGRYLGAVALAVLLGGSQALGFVLAPVLEWAGFLPAGTFAATPWAALLGGWLLFVVPCAFGFGALYLIAALRTRSLAGPFAVAAALMLCWVLSMVVFDDQANDLWTRLICPAGYTEVEIQVNHWTAVQKSTAALALTPSLLLNRLLWGGLPLLGLTWALWRVRREHLLLEHAPANVRQNAVMSAVSAPVSAPHHARHCRAGDRRYWPKSAGNAAMCSSTRRCGGHSPALSR